MTEAKKPPEKIEEAIPITENDIQSAVSPKRERQDPKKCHRVNSTAPKSFLVSAIAILLTLIIGAILYYQVTQQMKLQRIANQQLQDQLNTLHDQLTQKSSRLTALLDAQHQALDATKTRQDRQATQLTALQQKVAAIAGSDAKIWLLAQADFLVKLASRKLWIDQDITIATLLLKSADSSITEMDDPSLLNIRRAIIEDITTLSTLAQTDFDGIILKLNQLANQVDNLRLVDDSIESNSPEDENSNQLSSSLREWRQNLMKSWHNFMSNFITIRPRDATAEPLLAPNQGIYLRENIRAQLLIAMQAVPRHQNEVYRQSLEAVSTWVRAYFDQHDPTTKTFLGHLEELSQQSINQDFSIMLKSQILLDKQIQSRFGGLMTMPTAQQGE